MLNRIITNIKSLG